MSVLRIAIGVSAALMLNVCDANDCTVSHDDDAVSRYQRTTISDVDSACCDKMQATGHMDPCAAGKHIDNVDEIAMGGGKELCSGNRCTLKSCHGTNLPPGLTSKCSMVGIPEECCHDFQEHERFGTGKCGRPTKLCQVVETSGTMPSEQGAMLVFTAVSPLNTDTAFPMLEVIAPAAIVSEVQADDWCVTDTGGTCSWLGCDKSRSAKCEKGKCVCADGTCNWSDAGACSPKYYSYYSDFYQDSSSDGPDPMHPTKNFANLAATQAVKPEQHEQSSLMIFSFILFVSIAIFAAAITCIRHSEVVQQPLLA